MVTDTRVPPKEGEDEYYSQARPQEFMQTQDENPYLHTSDCIYFFIVCI